MSLDFNLIDKATAYSAEKLNGINTSELSFVENFLYFPLVEKLNTYIKTADKWVHDPEYNTHARTKINWDSDTVIEELHIVLNNLSPIINAKFMRNNHFLGLNIWKDTAGYSIGMHRDYKIINIALQVYLTEGVDDMGTLFAINGNTVRAEYKVNSGYLADNQKGIYHCLDVPVPDGHTRYSIYGVWSTQPKT